MTATGRTRRRLEEPREPTRYVVSSIIQHRADDRTARPRQDLAQPDGGRPARSLRFEDNDVAVDMLSQDGAERIAVGGRRDHDDHVEKRAQLVEMAIDLVGRVECTGL